MEISYVNQNKITSDDLDGAKRGLSQGVLPGDLTEGRWLGYQVDIISRASFPET